MYNRPALSKTIILVGEYSAPDLTSTVTLYVSKLSLGSTSLASDGSHVNLHVGGEPPSYLVQLSLGSTSLASDSDHVNLHLGGLPDDLSIEQTGTAIEVETGNSCTIPAGTELVILTYGFWHADGRDITAATLGGRSFTKAKSHASVLYEIGTIGLWYMVNPPVGSQLLSLTESGGTHTGTKSALSFWKNINTSSPLRSTADQVNNSTYETDSFSVQTYDLCVLVSWHYDKVVDVSGGGQTQIIQTTGDYWNIGDTGVAYKIANSSGTTTMVSDTSAYNYATMIAAAFRPAADTQTEPTFLSVWARNSNIIIQVP